MQYFIRVTFRCTKKEEAQSASSFLYLGVDFDRNSGEGVHFSPGEGSLLFSRSIENSKYAAVPFRSLQVSHSIW